jgi:hypothetical protein
MTNHYNEKGDILANQIILLMKGMHPLDSTTGCARALDALLMSLYSIPRDKKFIQDIFDQICKLIQGNINELGDTNENKQTN